MKIAVTGATGFVGSRLVERLQEEGHTVVALVRDRQKGQALAGAVEVVLYQPKQSGEWQQAIAGCDGVVNLAGEPLMGDRWTPERKQEILASRQQGTAKFATGYTGPPAERLNLPTAPGSQF